MDIQRLRNLTTGLVHTQMSDIYEDLEFITNNGGVMTHMIPRVVKAVEPWLRDKVTEPRFWDGAFDNTHVGEYPLEPMTPEENEAAIERYAAMPNPLDNKPVVVVEVY